MLTDDEEEYNSDDRDDSKKARREEEQTEEEIERGELLGRIGYNQEYMLLSGGYQASDVQELRLNIYPDPRHYASQTL